MRISDWSSDVCSSDLLQRRSCLPEARVPRPVRAVGRPRRQEHAGEDERETAQGDAGGGGIDPPAAAGVDAVALHDEGCPAVVDAAGHQARIAGWPCTTMPDTITASFTLQLEGRLLDFAVAVPSGLILL